MTTISSSEHVRLKLFARDAADIEVMSAYVQDMVLQVADMAHVSDQKRFVLLGNRFCWEDEEHPHARAYCPANCQCTKIAG